MMAFAICFLALAFTCALGYFLGRRDGRATAQADVVFWQKFAEASEKIRACERSLHDRETEAAWVRSNGATLSPKNPRPACASLG